jgi:hypothetical protein
MDVLDVTDRNLVVALFDSFQKIVMKSVMVVGVA